MMGLTFGRGRERAREEAEQAFSHIYHRLDSLEIAPPPTLTSQQIKATLDAIREGLNARLEAVDARMDGLGSDVQDVELRLKATNFAVSEGIERTDRAERRIHATIKRARKELKARGMEDPGLEAEDYELRIIDGTGSEGGKLPEVQPGVDGPSEAASSIRGVPAETLRRVRGF